MKKRKSKKTGNKLSVQQLQREILRLFRRQPKKRFNPRQVAKKLKVANNRDSIDHAMGKLVEEEKLVPLEDYKYKLKRDPGSGGGSRRKDYFEGRVDMTRSGSAYIVCEGVEDDIFVAAKNLNGALHGDEVRIRSWTPRGRRRPEGEVTQILKRATDHFLGTFTRYHDFASVVPDGRAQIDIYIPLDATKNASNEDKVVVEITDWSGVSGKTNQPIGRVTSVLGPAGSSDIEMKSILINNGFQLDFPEEVLAEAQKLHDNFTKEEIQKRRDLRGVPTFTIDPDDAKDFDDAISFQVEKGIKEIGVHIADVTHYVQPDTALDKEAFDRSTSVYLVDRVLPMLPEKLSNELCSLRPNEDKFTFSVIFRFDQDDRLVDTWIGKTITHSQRRFTYNQAQSVLDTKEGDFAPELLELNRMAHKLRKERFRQGSIAFETDEVQFKLDADGVPVSLHIKERKDAHLLIEDYMLLANKAVALFISEKGKEHEIPFVYRVHDEPDPEKVEEFARFSRELGFQMKIDSPRDIAKSFNKMVKAAEKSPGLKVLPPIAIRTMAKAEYSTDNIGHYGLGFSHYSHFTSPIRRYSDVLAHRILEKNLDGKVYRVKKEKLEEQCKHVSRQERRALDAERESIKYKQVEFIEKHVGEVFPGVISGIIERGFFVELKDNRCEGMIDYSRMPEPVDVDSGRLRARGRHSGSVYRMGDEILVKIVSADLDQRRIEMAWVEKDEV